LSPAALQVPPRRTRADVVAVQARPLKGGDGLAQPAFSKSCPVMAKLLAKREAGKTIDAGSASAAPPPSRCPARSGHHSPNQIVT